MKDDGGVEGCAMAHFDSESWEFVDIKICFWESSVWNFSNVTICDIGFLGRKYLKIIKISK